MTRGVGKCDSVARYNVVSCATAGARDSLSAAVIEATPIRIQTTSKADFDALLKLVRTSGAEPAAFAIPVGATEDDQSYTVAFDVGGRAPTELAVEASEHRLVVWGRRRKTQKRERRILMFKEPTNPESLEVQFAGGVINVRIHKELT